MTPGITRALLDHTRPTFSFEFFPPSGDEGIENLIRTIQELRPLQPDWVSVTYGATGASRFKSFAAAGAIRGTTAAPLMGHLTMAGQGVAEIRKAIEGYERIGIRTILAVRGDPPIGTQAAEEGLTNATDLVKLVKSMGDFTVGVAAFPHGHPEGDPDLDARILLEKQEAGASFAVTQLFFNVDAYVSMVDRFRAIGGTMPIVAGIMPVTVASQLERFPKMSGAPLPPDFEREMRAVADDPLAFRERGVELMTQLCEDVLEAGAPGLQFFTLNKSTATREIFARLQCRVPHPA